jgi:hypothetical protein
MELNEEHIRFDMIGHNYKIGDKVLLIPSLGCTTANHYDNIYDAQRRGYRKGGSYKQGKRSVAKYRRAFGSPWISFI